MCFLHFCLDGYGSQQMGNKKKHFMKNKLVLDRIWIKFYIFDLQGHKKTKSQFGEVEGILFFVKQMYFCCYWFVKQNKWDKTDFYFFFKSVRKTLTSWSQDGHHCGTLLFLTCSARCCTTCCPSCWPGRGRDPTGSCSLPLPELPASAQWTMNHNRSS